jgi:hypothetical protein
MLIELMVVRHLIMAEFADEHITAMSDDEISPRYLRYSEMESSAERSKNRVANVSSTPFSRPTTMTACAPHSTLFPSSRPSRKSGTVMPDSEVENGVRSVVRAVSPNHRETFRPV